MAIEIPELRQRLEQLLKGVDPTDQSALAAKLSEFFQYVLESYDQLDDEAKAYVDRAFEVIRDQVRAGIQQLPDGLRKRQLVRQFAIAEGDHFRAQGLLQMLESQSQVAVEIVPAARNSVVMILQWILDIMFDATRHIHRGPASFAKIGLFYWAIDELLVATHLAQRAFTNQSYAHIRTVFEILDLIELFNVQPRWAELWVGGNEKDVWNQLKPSAVRKKLGEPKVDPVYSFFSELGSHGTFRGLQARGAKVAQTEEGQRRAFRIWVGGCPMEHHVVWTNNYCVYTGLRMLVKCAKVFASFLNADEMRDVLGSAGDVTSKFFREHYIPWAKAVGLDPRPLMELIEREPWKADVPEL